MWICRSERPLQAGEPCHTLAVESGSTDFNISNVPSISTLLNCCQGLITVDKEASTVRLIHFTLREYISAHPTLFSRHHSTIAETCLSYLNSLVKALSADASHNLQGTPFLKYSSIYWGAHAKREFSEGVKSLALKLFEEYDHHISIKLLLEEAGFGGYDYLDNHPPFTGLHCASFFGIVEIAAALMEMKRFDINQVDFTSYTPPMWAAENDHGEVVKILLEQKEINPNKPGDRDATLVCRSEWIRGSGENTARSGRCQPRQDKQMGKTPISSAALKGHEGVVKILPERKDVDPNRPDCWGETPLSLAASNGHEKIVKMLLEQEDVNPERRDAWGRTLNRHF
ncbi:ankyrin [Choiromyces venosus 120613-1]|uniref:Ankyrin n=1 Tax=Choiromyces venosus 120613-1 TaxID=1336337 RepID=A0A3N4K3E8_9PEZI|nr:ankyrin [Choiromyces venosus 120613-1]